jgi:hypothetical protein
VCSGSNVDDARPTHDHEGRFSQKYDAVHDAHTRSVHWIVAVTNQFTDLEGEI